MKIAASLVLTFFAHAVGAEDLRLQEGDIVFQTSRSTQSVAVQRATGSRYSHMGMVFIRNGKPFVYEAVGKVKYTPLDRWVARGEGGRVVAKRLKDAPVVLGDAARARLRQTARTFEGKPYDLTFEWADDRIYCSELVWKVYQRALGIEIGTLQKIKEFNLKDPAVRQKMKERYGTDVPLNEPAISPVAMFDSPRLVTVLNR
jgi:uncharacterized protein YycO